MPRGPATAYSVIFQDHPTEGALLHLVPDQKHPAWEHSPLGTDIKDVQSNDPSLFGAVLRGAFLAYLTERHYLDLLGHGGGVLGFGTDQNQLVDGMSVIWGDRGHIPLMTIRSLAAAIARAHRRPWSLDRSRPRAALDRRS